MTLDSWLSKTPRKSYVEYLSCQCSTVKWKKKKEKKKKEKKRVLILRKAILSCLGKLKPAENSSKGQNNQKATRFSISNKKPKNGFLDLEI